MEQVKRFAQFSVEHTLHPPPKRWGRRLRCPECGWTLVKDGGTYRCTNLRMNPSTGLPSCSVISVTFQRNSPLIDHIAYDSRFPMSHYNQLTRRRTPR